MKKFVIFLIAITISFTSFASYKCSADGKAHIKKYETCKLVAYPDANGYSIGWGHHGSDVTKGMKINQVTADSYFEKDIKSCEMYANLLIKKLPYKYNFSQSFFDALVSLVYNCGYGNILNSSFYASLKRCRVKNSVMNEADYNFTVSKVKNTCVTCPGHKDRRRAEMLMMI